MSYADSCMFSTATQAAGTTERKFEAQWSGLSRITHRREIFYFKNSARRRTLARDLIERDVRRRSIQLGPTRLIPRRRR